MKPTPEAAWERVEALASSLGEMPPERLGAELEKLRNEGESATVLTLLSGMLALPPLPSGLSEGMVIGGRYTLRSVIGEGGMGTVWRARQENVGRDVALKMIHPALATPDLRSRFQQEIEMLSRLDHPGIVKVFDAGLHSTAEHPEIPYFAMELVEGEHLNQWAAKVRAEQGDLLQTAAFLCLAIHSAHERQVVHRDLKPSNILVKSGGQPVILDFGIARLAGIAAGDEGHQFSGTPLYAAPEQHLGNDRDFRSGESVDVYAMGAIVFEMLSGRKLFDLPPKTPFAEIRKAVLEAKPTRLSEVLAECPQELDAVIARAVRRNPADRFFSIAALGRALLRAAATVDDGKVEAPPWRPGAGATIPGTGWRLTEHLGTGSTGEVWLGQHADTGVVNVFKFCDSEEKVRSLKREATLFRLMKERVGQHPNLIQLHEVSLDEPPYYLMMERCDAKELGVWCGEQAGGLAGLPEEAKLEIVAQAADALQAAHDAGILHRDIKPANLLVNGDPAKGDIHVYVADFGIGQIVAEDLLVNGTLAGFTGTVTGAISGSLRYLAPEVLEGHAATARSDIYCLGVVLWQLLIGNLNAALDPIDWASRIKDPLLREDLARCLSGHPEHRWNSAAEFAASLRSLPQRRASERQRLAQQEARERAAFRRGAIRSAAIVAVVLSVVAVSLAIAWQRSSEAAKAFTRSTIQDLRTKSEGHSGDARNQLDKALLDPSLNRAGFEDELRGLATTILALPSFEPLEPPPFFLGPDDVISDAGDWLAQLTPKGPRVVELATGASFAVEDPTNSWTAKKLFINQAGRGVGIIDTNGLLGLHRDKWFLRHRYVPDPVYKDAVAIAPVRFGWNSSTVIAVSRGATGIELFSLEDHRLPSTILKRGSNLISGPFPASSPSTLLAFSKARPGLLAAAGPESGFALLWNVLAEPKTNITGQFSGSLWHPDDIQCLAWNPAANELATGCKDGGLRFWKPSSNPEMPQTEPALQVDLFESVSKLAWNADGSLLAVLLKSGRIKVLRPKGSQLLAVSDHVFKDATSIGFATGNRLFAWGPSGTKAWGPKTQGSFFSQRYIGPGNVKIAFHRKGGVMAAASGFWKFLNPEGLTETASLVTTDAENQNLFDDHVAYFSEGAWKHLQTMPDPKDTNAMTFGKSIKTYNDIEVELSSPFLERTAQIKSSRLILTRPDETNSVPAPLAGNRRQVVLSDWEPVSAWATGDNALHWFDHRTGKRDTLSLDQPALGLAFSPKAPLLACRTEDGVILVDTRNGTNGMVHFPAAGPNTSPLAFSPDGTSLALVAESGDLSVAELPDKGQLRLGGTAPPPRFVDVHQLHAPGQNLVTRIAWSHSGTHLCAGTGDGHVQSWNLSLIHKQLRLYRLNRRDFGVSSQPAFVPFRSEWP